MAPEDDGARDLAEALLVSSRALVGIAVRTMDDVEDMTLPQYRALVVLAVDGPQTVVELTRRVGVHQSTVTRLVTRLDRQGLVTRAKGEQDRRLTVVTPTQRGLDLVGRVMDRRREVIAKVVAAMDPAAAAAASRALTAFAQAADDVATPEEADGVL